MSSPRKASSTDDSPSSPTDLRASSPPPSGKTTTTANGTRLRSTAASKVAPSGTPLPPSTSSGNTARVIASSLLVILLALFLASQSSIPFSSFLPFELFKPSTTQDSWTSPSHSSASHQTRRDSGAGKANPKVAHKFGQPWSDAIPSSSPMFMRHRNSQAQEYDRRQREEKREQQRRHRQHSSPFDDFFGGGGSHDEQDDDESEAAEGAGEAGDACKGYYCEDAQVCVDSPIQCPCPYATDTKCLIGKWYVCYRGPHKC